jgi:hypothetical protein
MKSTILERYSKTPDGHYIIDITAGKVNDLYDDFDSYTPYVRKELDQNLVDYITDSARDLASEDFVIRFHLLEPPVNEMKKRITASLHSYFRYLKTIELNELGRVMRTSSIFLLLGLAILFLSVWVNENLSDNITVLHKVFAQGLTVAAWVALWEALATFLINWTPYSRRIKLYERIASAAIEFMPATEQTETAESEIVR